MEEWKTFESNTGSITVSRSKVIIKHKRGTYHGGKEKEIQIKSISAVEMKKPGKILAGYISFIFSGSKEASGKWVIDAAKNENTLMIGKKQYPDFLKCKELIDQYIEEAQSSSAAAGPSDADELMKWAALKDSGAITEEEYEVKKREILEAK
ncbi:SHOCT domain-containing protein [Bacillus velezensis]|uniref:SHOCT domain-containing protein n=1 Tax=Bacillus velezensis TaxID=492670 RepID=UPI0022830F43|nr:SHOCT domain-containing protein [Bacillus velezensis]MCY7683278.1 SHOCT domain-containing protein [Bacillus velezensis]